MPEREDAGSDSNLLARIQARDATALDELSQRHRAYLRKIISVRMDDRICIRVDSSDLIQETLLEAFTRIQKHPETIGNLNMPLRLWLRQIAIDRIKMAERKHLRTLKRGLYREVAMPEQSSILLARKLLKHEPNADFSRNEVIESVRRAVSELDAVDQEIITLRTFEGLPYKEITLLTGLSSVVARKRHGRALLRLHDRLATLLSDLKL